MADTLIILLLAAIVLAIFLLVDLIRHVKRLFPYLANNSDVKPPASPCVHLLIPDSRVSH